MGSTKEQVKLELAENFVDAFYSFNAADLDTALTFAQDSKPTILFYQGWAEGGNYKIVNRTPCRFVERNRIDCGLLSRDVCPVLQLSAVSCSLLSKKNESGIVLVRSTVYNSCGIPCGGKMAPNYTGWPTLPEIALTN